MAEGAPLLREYAVYPVSRVRIPLSPPNTYFEETLLFLRLVYYLIGKVVYRNSGKRQDKVILWGAPGSFWSGRTRSYFIKKGIEYQEVFPSNQRYTDEIIPLVGYLAFPIHELEDGTVIQDGTDIMDYFEKHVPEPYMVPVTPLQRSVAWLLELFGCDLFFIPAMHYRWNFPEQKEFLDNEFARALTYRKDKVGQQEAIKPAQDFFSDFPKIMGITEETIPAIEGSHIECLKILNEHFAHNPYLLGGRPSVADFGLIGPMFAHLGRDPVPASLMKNIAPHVYRWTERMFESNKLDGEFMETAYEYPENDELPQTLIPFLEYLFRDCGPQLQGMLDVFNKWVEDDPSRPVGTLIQTDPDAPIGAHPRIGDYDFKLRGICIHSQAFSNVVYHFQRVLDVIAALSNDGKIRFDSLMKNVGGDSLMSTKLSRRIKSEHYCFMLS